MWKFVVAVFFVLPSLASPTCVAQSSSNGLFTVRHVKKTGTALSPAQMRQAEKVYQSACAVVQRDIQGSGELHPRFTVLLGAERNAVYGKTEIWLKDWNPAMFAQGVVILAFDQMLTGKLTSQLAQRALEYSNASVDVRDLKEGR